MRKVLFFAMGLFYTTIFAQTGKVGINTEKPRATLDIVGKPITEADKTISRGVILPHISDAQKAEFTDKTEGLMIWNTTKKCIDFWNGTSWQCYGGATNTMPPTTTTYTGTAIWGDDPNERISVNRNNCPVGQTTTAINYPVNSSQRITYMATSTISQADANQKALYLMNSTAKQQERQALAQDYANANGLCIAEQKRYVCTAGDAYWETYSDGAGGRCHQSPPTFSGGVSSNFRTYESDRDETSYRHCGGEVDESTYDDGVGYIIDCRIKN